MKFTLIRIKPVQFIKAKPLVFFAALYIGSAALLKLVGFGLSIWLARVLTINEFSTWGLALSLQVAVATFGMVGIFESVVGLLPKAIEPDSKKALFIASEATFIKTATLSVLACLAWGGFASMRGAISMPLVAMASLSGAILAYAALKSQMVRLEEKHFSSLIYNFVIPLAGTIVSFIFFFSSRTVTSFFLGALIGLIFVTVPAFIKKENADKAQIHSYGSAIAGRIPPYFAIGIFGWLSGYGSNFLISFLLPHVEIARFTFAMTVSSVMQMVATALNQVWSPRFFKIIHTEEQNKVERKNYKFFSLQSILLGVTAGVTLALFPLLIKILGGHLLSYRDLEPDLAWMLGGYIILLPFWQCQNYFMAHDMGRTIMKIILITGVAGQAFTLVAIGAMGATGVYVGFFVQMLLRSAGMLIQAKKCWHLEPPYAGMLIALTLQQAGLLVTHLI